MPPKGPHRGRQVAETPAVLAKHTEVPATSSSLAAPVPPSTPPPLLRRTFPAPPSTPPAPRRAAQYIPPPICLPESPGEDIQVPSFSLTTSDSEEDTAVNTIQRPAPILVSPIKKRQRKAAPTINKLSDLAVWDMSDEEIIGEYR